MCRLARAGLCRCGPMCYDLSLPDRVAGWSSPVARWAHNPKVGGSNPPPATKCLEGFTEISRKPFFVVSSAHPAKTIGACPSHRNGARPIRERL
jgi:hypothetical protein